MILKQDRDTRCERREGHDVGREPKPLDVQNVWRQLAQQFAQVPAGLYRRCANANGQKEVVHSGACQLLGMRAGLDYRDPHSGAAGGLGNINQRRPRMQQLFGSASAGVGEKTDLDDVQQLRIHGPICSKNQMPGLVGARMQRAGSRRRKTKSAAAGTYSIE